MARRNVGRGSGADGSHLVSAHHYSGHDGRPAVRSSVASPADLKAIVLLVRWAIIVAWTPINQASEEFYGL